MNNIATFIEQIAKETEKIQKEYDHLFSLWKRNDKFLKNLLNFLTNPPDPNKCLCECKDGEKRRRFYEGCLRTFQLFGIDPDTIEHPDWRDFAKEAENGFLDRGRSGGGLCISVWKIREILESAFAGRPDQP